MNGKGSKDRVINKRSFDENYLNIDWCHFVLCGECGQPYKSVEKEEKMKFENNSWVCKQCNFN